MFLGVSKSGSPTPRSMTSRPAAFSLFAIAEIFIVVDSGIEASLSDTKFNHPSAV